MSIDVDSQTPTQTVRESIWTGFRLVQFQVSRPGTGLDRSVPRSVRKKRCLCFFSYIEVKKLKREYDDMYFFNQSLIDGEVLSIKPFFLARSYLKAAIFFNFNALRYIE